MSIFTDVKTQLDLPNIAEYYGVQMNRGGFASCLFHADRTPSMKLYSDHFHCYGCGKHGDVIALTERIFSMSPYEAARKLAQDFHIAYIENYVSANSNFKQYSCAEEENQVFKMLNEYCHFLEECREKYKPKNSSDELHPTFVESLTNYELYNYYCDIFISGSKEERIQFMKDFREGLDKIEQLFKEKNIAVMV